MTDWDDLRERLETAVTEMEKLQRTRIDYSEKLRLEAKTSGVRLALSYMDEYEKSHDEEDVVGDGGA